MRKIVFTLLGLLMTVVSFAQVTPSTDEAVHWYTISASQRTTKVIADNNGALVGEDPTNYARTMWKFVSRTDGSYDIINRASNRYISPVANYNAAMSTTADKPSKGWKLTAANTSGYYIISSGNVELNQTQAGLGWKIYNWSTKQDGQDKADQGCQMKFTEFTGTLAEVVLSPSFVSGYQTTGRGSEAMLLKVSFTAEPNTSLSMLYLSLQGTANVSDVKAYLTDKPEFYAQTLQPVATTSAADRISLDLASAGALTTGKQYYLYVTATVKAEASFSGTVTVKADSMKYSQSGTVKRANLTGTLTGWAKIFDQQHFLYVPTTHNCQYYRIPAMIVANDNSIITAADMRYGSNGDLGNHKIDVAMRRSTDNGKTWSEQKIIAVGDGTSDAAYGFGDPALVKTKSGRILCLMAAGKASFWSGLKHIYCVSSDDNGKTWSEPRDITSATTYTDEVSGTKGTGLFSLFTSSGKGLTTKDGRTMFLAVCKKENSNSAVQDFVLYTDDEGETWTLAKAPVYNGGDEAKLVQLSDGSILASVRQSGNRGFNKGDSKGLRWVGQTQNASLNGNACNADILVYNDKMLIHSILANTSSRQDLRLYVSLNNGETWKEVYTIQPASTAYSTMVKLSDGSLAIFFEDGSCGNNGYTLNFVTIPATTVESWGTDTGITVKVADNSGTGPDAYGSYTNDNKTWTSGDGNGVGGLTLTNDNSRFDKGNYFSPKVRCFVAWPSKSGATDHITITAPAGKTITGYAISAASFKSGDTYELSVTGGKSGKTATVTATTHPGTTPTLSESGLSVSSLTLAVKAVSTQQGSYIIFPFFNIQLSGTVTGTSFSDLTKAELQTWTTNGVGAYFGLSAEDAERFNSKWPATTTFSPDDYFDIRDSIRQHIIYPETGYYRMGNVGQPTYYLSYNTALSSIANDTTSVASVIGWTRNADGTYSLSVEGQYIQTPGQSKQVTLGTNAVKFTPEVLEPGKVCLGVNGGYSYIHSDAQHKIVGWNTIPTASEWTLRKADIVNVPLTLKNDTAYGTVMLPFCVTLPEGVKAYEPVLSADKNTVTLMEGPSYIIENSPFILLATGSAAATKLSLPVSQASLDGNASANVLKGTLLPMTWNKTTMLGMTEKDGAIGFYPQTLSTLPANQGYLLVSDLGDNLKTGFPIDFATLTGIRSLSATANATATVPAYNLSGQRVGKDYHGVVIVKGKKMLQR